MKIAYDVKSMRPGCAILQAAFGCDSSVIRDFPVESWIVDSAENLKVYEVTEEQLQILIERSKRAKKDSHDPSRSGS